MLMFQVELLRRSPKKLCCTLPLSIYIYKSWETHVQCLFSQFCHLNWRKQSSALWKGPWRRDVAMWNNDPCSKTREHLNNYTRLSPSPKIIKSSADSHEVRNPFLMALHLFRACVGMLSFGVGGPEFWLQFKTDVVRLLQASWLNNQHFGDFVNLSLPTNYPASFFRIVNFLVLHSVCSSLMNQNHHYHATLITSSIRWEVSTLSRLPFNPGYNLLVHKFPDLKKTCWRLKS